jgi:hypothetical protein
MLSPNYMTLQIQNTALITVTAVRTSNPTSYNLNIISVLVIIAKGEQVKNTAVHRTPYV